MRVVTTAPDGAAPIHAHAVRSGILLSCDGAWASGLESDGAARVNDLGRKLRARGPDRPVIAGLAVLFPMDWANQKGAVDQASVAGEEIADPLQRIANSLPGPRHLFRARVCSRRRRNSSGGSRQSTGTRSTRRTGFEIPAWQKLTPKLAKGALDWIASWFHAVALDLLVADLFDYRSNAEIVRFDHEFRRRRRRLAEIIEAAFLKYQTDDETISFAGRLLHCERARTGYDGIHAGPVPRAQTTDSCGAPNRRLDRSGTSRGPVLLVDRHGSGCNRGTLAGRSLGGDRDSRRTDYRSD